MKCPVCGYKHNVWNSDIMDMEYRKTEPFIIISQDMNISACPKCGVVIYKDGDER